tara:strand:+ start:23071 stop:23310 length:240 start_codon:yes stop_codon:yes gene_type:complete
MAQQKSRSKRRIKVKTPTGRAVIHYEPRKKSKTTCHCGARLHGVSQGRLAASKRNPSRPFGGVLCSRCSRAAIKEGINA